MYELVASRANNRFCQALLVRQAGIRPRPASKTEAPERILARGAAAAMVEQADAAVRAEIGFPIF